MDLVKLLEQLTIEEKIGQLTMLSPHFFLKDTKTEIFGYAQALGLTDEAIFQTGSVLGIGDASEMIEVQKRYLANSRHQIPLIFMADIIHGYETIFPVPLGLASSWNETLIQKVARISAIEASTAGIHVTFAPMADLSRDPRWGRVVESFGEDPLLNRRFTKAQVIGYQNDGIEKQGNIASCVKHFAAYGAVEAGKDYNTVDISRINLYQNYLSGYQAAIDAGAKVVMTSFNVFEGIPATTNQFLLDDVLRKSLNFKGVTISDYASLKETITHGTSETPYSAAVQGMKAGLDIEMATALYMSHLKQALDQNDISIEAIDAAVLRVLKLKLEAGLFENPYQGASIELEQELVRSKKHLEVAKQVSDESIVLLKNNHIFPIKQGKIALIGPYAQSGDINGPWSWHGDKHHNESLYEVLKHQLDIHYLSDGDTIDFKKVHQCDYIILAMGEHKSLSGEAKSRSDIKLPDNQETLIQHIRTKTKQPLGLIIFNGRPLDLTDVEPSVDGMIVAFFPGSMGAHSLADIITGKVNPSGKLTMSFPRSVGQIPVYYNTLNTGRPITKPDKYKSYYLDVESSPLYPFGYGLSYSRFEYSNLRLSSDTLKPNETLTVLVDIENTSPVAGQETVQLYMRDYFAKVSRPVLELIDFKKIDFKAAEKKTIEFQITKASLLYYGPNLKLQIDPGKIGVFVGPNSTELLKSSFEYIEEV